MLVGSLFTGCYGLDLGLEAAGMETAWACEIDAACRRILARRRPGLPVASDVRELGDRLLPVELLAGGFPCQDLSYAGRGAGLDGERSALWFEMARCVRLLRPPLVVVENVPAIFARGFGRVVYDLAEAGYVGRWFCLSAASIGAPHIRERVFIVARRGDVADAWSVARQAPGQREAEPVEDEVEASLGGPPGRAVDRAAGRAGPAADAAGAGRPGEGREVEGGRARPRRRIDWGTYERAIRRWEDTLGRPAPRPTDDRGRVTCDFVEWMLGFPEGWTEGEAHGQRLKMLGNSVQVQVAEQVGRMVLAGVV